jgi:hypothetical protein
VDAGSSFQSPLVHHLSQLQFSPHHSAYRETGFIPVDKLLVVQNLVDLDASLLEFRVEAVLQVGLAKPPVHVVAIFGEDLPNVAPFPIVFY